MQAHFFRVGGVGKSSLRQRYLVDMLSARNNVTIGGNSM